MKTSEPEVVVDVYKGGLVMLAIIAIISLIIICTTIIIGMYIYYCAQREVKLFAKPEYYVSLHDLKILMRSLIVDVQQIKREIQDMNGKTEENSFKKEETSCS